METKLLRKLCGCWVVWTFYTPRCVETGFGTSRRVIIGVRVETEEEEMELGGDRRRWRSRYIKGGRTWSEVRVE